MEEIDLFRQIITKVSKLSSELRVLNFNPIENYSKIREILSALQNLERVVEPNQSKNKLLFFAEVIASSDVQDLKEIAALIIEFAENSPSLPEDGITLEWKGMIER